MSLDRFWNNVPLIVQCSASPFVEARHAYTVTQGSVTVTFDSGTKPGAAWAGSAYFSGSTSAASGHNGTQLRLNTTDDFTLGTGDFTIEAWAAYSTAPMPNDSGVLEFVPYPILERQNASSATGAYALQLLTYRIQGVPDVAEYHMTFYCGDYSAGTAMLDYTLPSLPTDWHHYAVTRNGNEFTLWMDGVPLHRVISTVTIASPPGAGAEILLGNSVFDTSDLGNSQTKGRSAEMYIASVRITKGYCRYGRSFEQAITDMTETPGAPVPETEDTGDYSSETYRGATGATGADVSGPPEDGEDGTGGPGVAITLPEPLAQYDQANENATRRLIMDATRRGG